VSPQTSGGTQYVFSSWSDGGLATHEIATPAASTTFTATFAASTGGLTGQYFDNTDFTALRVTRTDPGVNFNFGTGAPAPGVAADTFAIRWTGTITPQFSQAYTLYTTSDDGIRLWFNGGLLIDNFTNHSPTENSGVTPVLVAGQAYPIQIDYFENTGGAVATFSWSSASQTKQIVPQSRLAPGTPLSFPIRINFQPSTAAVPAGYVVDAGAVFGSRGGGLSFGWNVDHADVTRERNVNANQLLDTLCHFHAGGVWELALPFGRYDVRASIGDPSFSSTHTLIAESTTYWSGAALGANQFLNTSNSVLVSDGRLTVTQGAAADKATRINFIEISRP
jgi:hypothetical protein